MSKTNYPSPAAGRGIKRWNRARTEFPDYFKDRTTDGYVSPQTETKSRVSRLTPITLNELKHQTAAKVTDTKNIVEAKTRYIGEQGVPLERQTTFLHQRLSKYLQDVQGLDEETLKRYKRLATHMVMNKMDPLQLDEFKFSFLSQASPDQVSITIR